MYVVFLSFMMWDRGQSIDTLHQSCPSSIKMWKKTKSQLLQIQKYIKTRLLLGNPLIYLYSDMIEHHRQQENLYYVIYFDRKELLQLHHALSIKLKFPFRFQLCAVERNFPSQNAVYFIFIIHQCHCIRIQLLLYYCVYSISLYRLYMM